MSEYRRVAVDAPIDEALTYALPDGMTADRGQLVTVPLGKRKIQGVVLGPAEKPAEFEAKPIEALVPDSIVLPEAHVQWIEWLSRYYIHPPGQTALLSYPPLEKKTKLRASKRPPVVAAQEASKPPTLTEEQRRTLENIPLDQGFAAHLIFGVTGSGKTEIYLHLLEKILAEGKGGLVLVPEISLTPQLVQRFAARFGDRIAALHSQLTDRERTTQWWDVVEGRKKILIGARSALFCPIPDLGLIVIDEEHEQSFKQEEKLKYHGRDAAVMKAKLSNCPIVLGSATPSLESWKNALDEKYRLHRLKNRVADRALPEVEIVDLRAQTEKDPKLPTLPFWMGQRMYARLIETLEEGNQAAFFLNRRGMAPMVVCPLCGHTRECPNCDINLTLHAGHHLVCHYCDYHENFRVKCQDCGEGEMEAFGLGTELIEKDLQALFPDKNLARADRDEITNRADLENLIQDMERGKIDILVGTQMIAKGLDFPKLKLVGLVLADIGFNLPDFRATERSFQLMVQMSGRSGRHVKPGESPGRVVIQTYNPEHDSLRYAIAHDYEAFAQHELMAREALHYPPHGRLLGFRIQAPSLDTARQLAKTLAGRARALKEKSENFESIQILGPAEAPLAKLRNQFRFHLLLKGPRGGVLNTFARRVLGDEKWIPSNSKILVDIDPLNLL